MKAKNKIILFLSLFIFFSFFLPFVSATWWDTSWTYKIPINISVASGSTPQDYQVKLILNSSNVGTGFNWVGECESNTSRIRFVNGSENSEFAFWVKECSDSGENMTVWVKVDQNITTTPYTIYMYYGNPTASLLSNGTVTFEFFDDFNSASADTSKWTVGGSMTQSGGIATGSTSGTDYFLGKTRININTLTYIKMQDKSTGGIARPGVLATNGNPYSVVGFGWQDYSNNYRYTDTYNTGITQVQRNTFTTNWYVLETSYNSTTVNFIVNGAILGTHTTQIPTSDKVLYGQVEGNANYDLFYTRKWVSVEPTYILGVEETPDTSVTSLSPANGYISSLSTVTFNCSAVSSSTTELTNITLYGNWSGEWHANETKSLTGTPNSTSFTKTVSSTSGNYLWNCLVYDNESNSDWFDSNYTFSIDTTPPQITINSPIGAIADETPLINVSLDEIGTIWYNIDNGTNTTLCTDCNSADTTYLHLAEGSYTIYVFANDTSGNLNNTESSLFTIDMNKNYFDSFDDNSSINIWNDLSWQKGNVSFIGDIGELSINSSMVLLYHSNNDSAYGESDSLVYDFAGGNNNGSVSSATWTNSGKYRGGFNFDGINDYILTNQLGASPSTQTSEVWFKPLSPGGCLVDELGQGTINTGYHYCQIEVQTNGDVKGKFWNLNAITIGTVNWGEWNHVALVYDGSTMYGYLNGVVSGESTTAGRTPPSAWYMAFGPIDSASLGNPKYFNGTIDEAAVWNIALSPSVILSHATTSLMLSSNFTSYLINTTNNITSVDNVTWTEDNTDTNNNISVEVSADSGANWYTATNGQALGQDFTGANNSLIYRVLFATSQSQRVSLLDMNISWSEQTVAADTSYPQFLDYWDNNASLVGSGVALFNVTIENTNGTVFLEINGTNYTANNITLTTYNYSLSLTNGTYSYKWHSWGNGTNHLYNASDERSYFVNAFCSPTLNQNWTISDTQICNGVQANTGTGKIIILGDGELYLINGANVTAKKFEISTTGDRVFINSGSKFKVE